MTEAEIATTVASETVKIAFSGSVAVMRVAGKTATHAAALLAAVLSGKKKSKGKVRLQEMLKEGVSLISIKEEDRANFAAAARKYGIKYCVVKDKDNKDGTLDIFIRTIDAPVINRIMDKYEMAIVEQDVKISVEKDSTDKMFEDGDITIDKDTLIVEETEQTIRTRVPGTYGNNVRYLYLDKLQVAELNDGKTYLTHIDKESKYEIYDKDGQVEVLDGDKLLAYYDNRGNAELKNSESLTDKESQLGKNSKEQFKENDITISKDKNSLIIEETPEEVRTRVPGTFGEGERHVYFYREELQEAYGGKSYKVNIDRERKYTLYDQRGMLVGAITGEALLNHYDKLNDSQIKPVSETKPSVRERMDSLQRDAMQKKVDKTKGNEPKAANVVKMNKSPNKFNNINQREYDFDALEKHLLNNNKTSKEHEPLK